MAVSLIYSTFHDFGSGLASARFGIDFQSRGAGFTLRAGHPNEAGGGKRPMHTIIPAMLRREGRVVMPFGVMGGAYQPAGHVRLLSNLIDFGLDPQAAIDAPRSFADAGEMQLETGYSESVAAELAALGHKVARREPARRRAGDQDRGRRAGRGQRSAQGRERDRLLARAQVGIASRPDRRSPPCRHPACCSTRRG